MNEAIEFFLQVPNKQKKLTCSQEKHLKMTVGLI